MGYLSRHNVHRIFVSSLLFAIVSFINCVNAQVVDDTMHVVYAKPADRISVRTNSIDWLLQSPNVGLEYSVRAENWNRWAVGLNVKGRWKGENTYKPGLVYNLNQIRVDFKNYWRERFVRGEGSHALDGNVDPHVKWIDKLFSMRRKNLYDESDPKHTYPYLKHPAIVFFRGLYGSYDMYSFKMGKTGYQGSGISIGGTYGIIRTLHEYEKGGRLDLELGVSAGWMFLLKCQEYTLNRVTNSYVMGKNQDGKLIPYPLITDLRLGVAYHFGKMPLTKQYRWRYDADSAFHVYVDSLAADRQAKWEQKQINKSFKSYIQPVKSVIADARKTLNSWPDSIYSYMVLQRAIEQAVKDSSEILMPVYVNKGIVYDKDGETKIEIIKRELEYYKGRAESYVEAERRIKFIADSIYADSVKKVMDDSIAAVKRGRFLADSLRRDSLAGAKRLKFVNDSIMKDSLKQAKAALKDSLDAMKAEARQRVDADSDSTGVSDGESAEGAEGNSEEVVPIDGSEQENTGDSSEIPVAAEDTTGGSETESETSEPAESTGNTDDTSDSSEPAESTGAGESTESSGEQSSESDSEQSESSEGQSSDSNTEQTGEDSESSEQSGESESENTESNSED